MKSLRTKIVNNKDKIYSVLVYFCVFLFSVFPYSDLDWGWHLKYGENFLKTGSVLRSNPFTWTLVSFPWVNHSWLFDPLLYVLYRYTGYLGLMLAGGVLAWLAFYLITSHLKLSYWKIGLLGFFFVRLNEAGMIQALRSQVVATMLLATLMAILIKARTNPKFLLSLPLLFILWANLHGTFLFALGIATVFLGSDFLLKAARKEEGQMRTFCTFLAIGSVSGAAALVNPFGSQVYLEALKHASNPLLQDIYEWQTILTGCSYCHEYTFFAYLGILAFAFYQQRKRWENLPFFLLALVLAVLAINARRYLPIFVVVTLPVLGSYLEGLRLDWGRYRSVDFTVVLAIAVAILTNIFWRFTQFDLYQYSESDYCRFSSGCSPVMADYLLKSPPKGHGFNFYDWGGYLIGKGITFKLFIDGRMTLWSEEGYTPFADYVAIYYKGDGKKFNEYNFDWVLIPRGSSLKQKLTNTNTFGRWVVTFSDGNSLFFTRIR